MKFTAWIPVFLGLAGALAFGRVSIKPAGVQVVWNDGGDSFGTYRTFMAPKGIRVAVAIDSDGPVFFDIVEDESKVVVGGAEGQFTCLGEESELSEDRKHMMLEIRAPGGKVRNGKVALKGYVVALMASKKAKATTKMLDLKKGTTVEFPPGSGLAKFTVEKAGKPDWGGDGFVVRLKCRGDIARPMKLKIIGPDGEEQRAKLVGWSRKGMGKQVTVSIDYMVEKKVARGKLAVEYWKDTQKVRLPLNLSVGLDGTVGRSR